MEFFSAIIATTMDENNPVAVWDSTTGTLLSHYRGGGSVPRHCVAASGGYVFASERGKPLIHSWAMNKQHCDSRRLIAPGKIDCFDFSPDYTHIAVAVSEKLYLYQLASGKLLGTTSKHYQSISVVKFNSTGSLVGCGGQDGMITVWTLSNIIFKNEPFFSSMDHNLPVNDLCFTSGNLRARIISVSVDFSCKIFELASGKQLLSIGYPSRPTCLALTSNEVNLFIGSAEGGIFETNLFEKSRKIAEYHEAPENNRSTFAGSHDETIMVWHIESHQCIRKIPQKGVVTNVIFKMFSYSNFTTDFKPKPFPQSFINPASEEAQKGDSFEIFITDGQLMEDYKVENTVKFESNSSQSQLEKEIEKLKMINSQLYSFSVKSILNGPSGVDHDSVMPFNNVTMSPLKKKVKQHLTEVQRKKKSKTNKLKMKKKKRKEKKQQ